MSTLKKGMVGCICKPLISASAAIYEPVKILANSFRADAAISSIISSLNKSACPRPVICSIIIFASSIVRTKNTVPVIRSEEHTSELQSRFDLVCRLLLEKKKNKYNTDKIQKKKLSY